MGSSIEVSFLFPPPFAYLFSLLLCPLITCAFRYDFNHYCPYHCCSGSSLNTWVIKTNIRIGSFRQLTKSD